MLKFTLFFAYLLHGVNIYTVFVLSINQKHTHIMKIKVNHIQQRFPRSENENFNAAINDFRNAFKAAMQKCDNVDDENFNQAVKDEMAKNGYIERTSGIETPEWVVAWNNNDDTAIMIKKH